MAHSQYEEVAASAVAGKEPNLGMGQERPS